MPYASSAPAGLAATEWPPTKNEIKGAAGKGLTISVDDFLALTSKAEVAQIEEVLASDVAPSQAAVDARTAVDAQLAALVKPMLPAGVTLRVDYAQTANGWLVLTGPSGTNSLEWYTAARDSVLAGTNNLTCSQHDPNCTVKKVAGGTAKWTSDFSDPQNSVATFDYVPDDPKGSGAEIKLFGGTRDVLSTDTPAASTPQLTFDQMVAMVTDPRFARIAQTSMDLGK
ncbi:hypothetical protein ACFQ9X_30320 [Catenulispora yoronensis]